MQRAIRFEAVNVCSSSSTHRSISRPLFTWSNKYDMTSIEYFTHIIGLLFNHHMMRCAFLMMMWSILIFCFSFASFIIIEFIIFIIILSSPLFFILYLPGLLSIFILSLSQLFFFHHSFIIPLLLLSNYYRGGVLYYFIFYKFNNK